MKDHNKRQRIVLCGGPDRCGKTNILKALSRVIGVPYFKASNEHSNFLSKQDNFVNELRYSDFRMVDLLKQTGQSVLVDRSYMCEWVYSRFFGRRTDRKALRRLDDHYAELNALLLICTRRSFVGISDDLDPTLDSRALQEISELYLSFARWTHNKNNLHVMYVDDEDLLKQTEEIETFMKKCLVNQE